jgi:hypothetical protein
MPSANSATDSGEMAGLSALRSLNRAAIASSFSAELLATVRGGGTAVVDLSFRGFIPAAYGAAVRRGKVGEGTRLGPTCPS